MLIRGEIQDQRIVLTARRGTLTVGIGTDEVCSWDLEGRPYSIWADGRTWRRGLEGRAVETWREGNERRRRTLEAAEVDALADRAADRARTVLSLIGSGDSKREAETELDTTRRGLARAAEFDAAAARADARRFASIYRPIGVLPPDQYLAFVAQATEGCMFGSCSFCNLYHQAFRVKTPTAFRQHLAEAKAYLGDSLLMRDRSVFLGAANALALPTDHLVVLFGALEETLGGHPGICAFIDGFMGSRKGADEYAALRRGGLKRVYIGLESGHDPLLAAVHKPGSAGDALAAVQAMKAAGLSVGVIVIVGLGGVQFENEHLADTTAALQRMALGPSDLVYFSNLVEDSVGTRADLDMSTRLLSEAGRERQRSQLQDALKSASNPPRMATYDVREFVY
jgi:radical SAM superfamily enzyme YgiQ (UPF0313 family)